MWIDETANRLFQKAGPAWKISLVNTFDYHLLTIVRAENFVFVGWSDIYMHAPGTGTWLEASPKLPL